MLCLLAMLVIVNINAADLPEGTSRGSPIDAHFPEVHPEASKLNRYTFAGNVLHGTGDRVKSWVVIFCTEWHDRCQGLIPSYELLGAQWEEKLNSGDLFESSVRFIQVDCATDKALCNSQGVEDYPTVMHYQNGKAMSFWTGGAPGLVRWVKQALTGQKPKQSLKPVPSQRDRVQETRRPILGGPTVSSVGNAMVTRCDAEKQRTFKEDVSKEPTIQGSSMPLERLLFTAVTGFLFIIGLGIRQLSTPQILGPRPLPPLASSIQSATARAAASAFGQSSAQEQAKQRQRIEL